MAGDDIRRIDCRGMPCGRARVGDPAFADASRPGDEQIVLAADPIAIDELGKEGAIDAARSAQIDIFDDCGLP